VYNLAVMPRSKRLSLMVSEKEYLRLREYAETQELSMSEILRDYLKSLPDTQPLGGDTTSGG
jgi:hypothetical protein